MSTAPIPTDWRRYDWRRPVDVGEPDQGEVVGMPHPRPVAAPPLEQRQAFVVQRTRHTVDSDLLQNDHGDIVVPAGLGEVVLLPRLWDFELVHGVGDGLTVVSRSGLVAFADIVDGVGVRVTEVIARRSGASNLLEAGAS